MTSTDRQKLRKLCLNATPGPWMLQTSNSWRRIGTAGARFADGNVLMPTTRRGDNHPDLSARQEDLDFIVAADPATVLALLDEVERLEQTAQGFATRLARIGRAANWLSGYAEGRNSFSRIQEINDAIQEVPDGH